VASDASKALSERPKSGKPETAVEKAKDLAKDYLVEKADSARDTLKTVSKVADTAG
jgi:hypothetical protein